jgi:ATP-dependent Clp endopeptidase proteolytic subunit ClpP
VSKQWYEIKNLAERHAELWIYEQIGEDWWTGGGVTAKQFCMDMAELDVDTIALHINSPGGLVFEGQAIYNAIKNHPATVTSYIDGVAASIASVIALAADTVVMASNALFMIHQPFGGVSGRSATIRKYADTLDKVSDTIVGVYQSKTGKEPSEIIAAMDAETWFTADEAIAFGFADEVDAEIQMAACAFDFKALGFENAPDLPATTDTAPPEPEDTDDTQPPEAGDELAKRRAHAVAVNANRMRKG